MKTGTIQGVSEGKDEGDEGLRTLYPSPTYAMYTATFRFL
jgi:hypothetical protein